MDAPRSLFWSAYARVYDLIWDSAFTRAANQVLFGDCGQAGSVVDLGCGTGLSSHSLVSLGWHVVGVDASASMLRRALGLGRVSEVVCADAADTGLPAAQAGLVIVNNVLQLHPRPLDVLSEAARLVAPGGQVVCAWPAPTATFAQAVRADRQAGRAWPPTLAAACLRVAVGIPGALVGARRWSGEDVAAAVAEFAADRALSLSRRGTILGVEDYAVIAIPLHFPVFSTSHKP